MSSVDPQGSEKYWFDGLPFEGVLKSGASTGGQKYWSDGLPAEWLLGSASSPSTSPSSSVSASPSPSGSPSTSPSTSPSISESASPSSSPSESPSASPSTSPSESISSSPSPSESPSSSPSTSASSSPSAPPADEIDTFEDVTVTDAAFISFVFEPFAFSNATVTDVLLEIKLSRGITLWNYIFVDDVPTMHIPVLFLSVSDQATASSHFESKVRRFYSRGHYAILPSNDNDLTFTFDEDISEYAAVATEDDIYVPQSAYLQKAIFLFKNQYQNNLDAPVDLVWKGRTTIAPSASPVYLQMYNRTSGEWETVDSNNSEAADTKFTLSYRLSSNFSDYYDDFWWISCRVYQDTLPS